MISSCWTSQVAQFVNAGAPDGSWRQACEPGPSCFLCVILSYTYRKVWDRLYSHSQPLCSGVQASPLDHDRSGLNIDERKTNFRFQQHVPSGGWVSAAGTAV